MSDTAAAPVGPLALSYRVCAAIAIAAGLARITGLFSGAPSLSSLTFYTVQSNVLCLLWMVALIVVTVRDIRLRGVAGTSTPSARGSALVMMAITITMLVYLVVLVPATFVQDGGYEPFSLTDNLIHIVTPCLLIADWLLFVPKGRLAAVDPLLWLVAPIAYLVFAFGYGALGGEFMPGQRYPYPFLDVAAHGVVGVAWRVAALGAALAAVGYVYFGIDRLFARRRVG